MFIKKLFLIIFIALFSTCFFVQSGQAEKAPNIIDSGFTAYNSGGAEAAIQAWVKGSPIENDKAALSQANILRQIETYYGNYQSYDIVGSKKVGQLTTIYYIVANFEQGPVFVNFTTFKKTDMEIIPTFNFNTTISAVFPPDLATP